MNLLRLAAPPAVVLFALAGPASARDVTAEERAALGERVAAFHAAMTGGDAAILVDMLPPRILPAMAALAGMTIAEATTVTIGLLGATLADLTGISFKFDFPATEFRELPDGTPYALIPSAFFMSEGNTTIRVVSNTLAILDEDGWYLIRVDDTPQLDMLRDTYPLFVGIEFAEPIMQVIER
jgi:hypothetical protein